MSETAKRYLLPSEIEGVLRGGNEIYIIRFGDLFRYEWSPESGLSRFYKCDGGFHPANHAETDVTNTLLSSYECFVFVSVCECGRPMQLDDKCSICDDYFG